LTEPQQRIRRAIGAVLALGLIALVLYLARPASVWELLRRTDGPPLAAAAALAVAAAGLRGLRLKLLLPAGRLGGAQAVLIVGAAQAAAMFVPARAGEAALPWLLRRSAGWELTAGLSTLLAARALDLASLGAWAGAGALAVWGLTQPAALVAAAVLLATPLLLPTLVRAAERTVVRTLAVRGLRWRRWARRLRRLRQALDDICSRPLRLAGAALASLAMWAATWAFTWLLLVAMGYRWPLAEVVAGSAVASLANLLPVNLVANLGTLEAGWTAAFTTLGKPIGDAAASGFGAHLWALVFAAAIGAVCWLIVLSRRAVER